MPETWHHGLVARWWAEFNTGGPEVEAYRPYVEAGPTLDVACGTGRLLLPWLRAGLDVDGCDVSADMIRLCREQAEREGLVPTLFVQGEIEEAAFRWNAGIESGERVIVGVNRFAEAEPEEVELLRLDPESELRQIERTARVRAERDPVVAAESLAEVGRVAAGTGNLLPPMREALRARCTIGEICDVLRAEFGTFDASRA
jgi:SAM-dependent methyltransferase